MSEASTSKQQNQDYVPGVCNINKEEIAYRRKAGYLGLAIFVVLLIVLLIASISRWFHLVLFFPAFLSAIGFLQAKNHFCVGYGTAGTQNATEGSKKASKVTDQSAAAKDKAHARQMNLQAAGIALLAAVICVII